MRTGVALLLLASACRFTPLELPGVDAAEDTFVIDACVSSLTQLDTCLLPGGISVMLGGNLMFDTDLGTLSNEMGAIQIPSVIVPTRGGEVRAITATSFVLLAGARLRATGTRGLAIIASDTITLMPNAIIDVGNGGAGHRVVCNPSAVAGMDDTDGAAGGGGGGAGAPGGGGGNGDFDNGQSTGGAGGPMFEVLPSGPVGGCPGANGGNQSVDNPGGRGGAGGGALYMYSAKSIGIGMTGGVQAGGGGGGGGQRTAGSGDAGGAGGGSGGTIFLESRMIRVDGILAANGGGGGEGSGGSTPGNPGSAGTFGTMPAAPGANNSTSGVNGGAGGALGVAATTVIGVNNGGGGGGGGGVGIVHLISEDVMITGLVSPQPIIAP